jgi:tRNA modification GTPase
VIKNKIDKLDDRLSDINVSDNSSNIFHISVMDGTGLDGLLNALSVFAGDNLSGQGKTPVITRARHRTALAACLRELFDSARQSAGADEMVCESLRMAVRQLGRVAGRVDVEDVLDVVFRDFCIGK